MNVQRCGGRLWAAAGLLSAVPAAAQSPIRTPGR